MTQMEVHWAMLPDRVCERHFRIDLHFKALVHGEALITGLVTYDLRRAMELLEDCSASDLISIDPKAVKLTASYATRSAEVMGVILLAYKTCRHVPLEWGCALRACRKWAARSVSSLPDM